VPRSATRCAFAPTPGSSRSTTTSEVGDIRIRPARESDAERVAAIYNQGIEERQATFQTRLHKPGELEGKINEGGGLLLVAELDGEVVGWAGFAAYDDPAEYYAGVAESALYVDRAARRRGVGRALLEALATEAAGRGRYKLTAKIFTTNESSIALFRACGWSDVGVHRRHGRLDGEWKDVLVMERLLDDTPSG
jgi:L-amino acid N-acyltransferase YncA